MSAACLSGNTATIQSAEAALKAGGAIVFNNRVDGTTVSLDAATLSVIRSYRVPGGPDCIEFAPDGKLWITQRFIQKVGILDPVSGALSSVPVGRSPHGIFLTTALRAP